MGRILYFYSKLKSAWATKTLGSRVNRFLFIAFMRPLIILIGYTRLNKADRKINIKEGFADHRQKKSYQRPNQEHLCRIISAYKESKRDQATAALPYQIRGVWKDWLLINYKNLICALENEDISTLSTLYENMFREQFTTGAGGYDNYLRYRAPLGDFYIKYVWSSYRDKLLELDFDLQKIKFPLIGNPTGVILNGDVISIDTLRYAYHAVEMRELLRDVPKAVIVEIGGGLGGQTYQTIQMSEQVSKYLVFDIPEVASISSFFLLSAFPNKNIRLYGEGSVSPSASEEYDIGVFPHFAIHHLPDFSVDLFYNSCSFSEMDRISSREYLSIIERACRRYFMHDNHDTVFEFRYPDGSISVNEIGSKLIPAPATFKRVFKKPRVHGLPEDSAIVQFEYLYEKYETRGSIE
jgi:putative sugar O-methyltransferase